MWYGQPEPAFLTLEEVLALHQEQIELFGGDFGVLNLDSVDSAISQPKVTFEGVFLHSDIFAMAAVYLYHLVTNHGFVDGNKRIGNVAAHVFLMLNGIEIIADPDELAELVLGVANGTIDKDEIAQYFRTHAQPYKEDSDS